MDNVTVIEPGEVIVSLDEAKRALRLETADDDVSLESLWLPAAQAHLEQEYERSFSLRTLEFEAENWSRVIDLPGRPIRSIVAVTEIASDEDETTVSLTNVRLLPSGLRFINTYTVPSGRLRVRYTAGFDTADPRLATVRQAITLLAGHWNENREASTAEPVKELPMAVTALMRPFRTTYAH